MGQGGDPPCNPRVMPGGILAHIFFFSIVGDMDAIVRRPELIPEGMPGLDTILSEISAARPIVERQRPCVAWASARTCMAVSHL